MWWLFGIGTGLSIVAVVWQAYARIRRERRQFRTAITRSPIEITPFIVGGLMGSILLSIISVSLALFLPTNTLVALGVISLLGLVVSRWHFSVLWLGLSIIPMLTAGTWQLAALLTAMWLLTALLLQIFHVRVASPMIKKTRRGKIIAQYSFAQFYWLPLIVPVPGHWFAAMSWWPTIGVGNTSFGLLFLPLVLGSAFVVRHQLPEPARKHHIHLLYGMSLAMLVLTGLSYGVTQIQPYTGWLVLALTVIGIGLDLLDMGKLNFTKTKAGVLLLAVVPDTPAAKMGLAMGELVVTCNDIAVYDNATLYAAIQTSPTYCRLKVADLNGELRLTESAIFEGAPHELGMITFPEETA